MVSEYIKLLILVGIMAGALGTVNRGIDAWVTREQAYYQLEVQKLELEKKMFERTYKT